MIKGRETSSGPIIGRRVKEMREGMVGRGGDGEDRASGYDLGGLYVDEPTLIASK